ncbi:hypothetical protein ACIHAX_30840 [Nocardia sp. NPDC051929]|uniref:hypothetical protein n=1 Tax=Nocardia sp. NPDC051929 TaxID=3364327 RepID=UPI0037C6D14B
MFLVAGGHGAVALEPVDTAFDGVALPVHGLVERRWPPTAAATVAAMAGLVGRAEMVAGIPWRRSQAWSAAEE